MSNEEPFSNIDFYADKTALIFVHAHIGSVCTNLGMGLLALKSFVVVGTKKDQLKFS